MQFPIFHKGQNNYDHLLTSFSVNQSRYWEMPTWRYLFVCGGFILGVLSHFGCLLFTDSGELSTISHRQTKL